MKNAFFIKYVFYASVGKYLGLYDGVSTSFVKYAIIDAESNNHYFKDAITFCFRPTLSLTYHAIKPDPNGTALITEPPLSFFTIL